jgi:very-short-patch-repair endonuclease
MRNTKLARAFRRDLSRAERRFWYLVRAGRLEGFKFRRQVPIGRFVVDFICMDARLIVELDGVSHQGREAKDEARTQILERLGYLVIRFPNHEVLGNANGVAVTLLNTLRSARPKSGLSPEARKPSPSHAFGAGPSLSLAGEGL